MTVQNSSNHSGMSSPIFGDGSDGAITRTGAVAESTLIQATTYTVNVGAMVTPATGIFGIAILATRQIVINGTISADGVYISGTGAIGTTPAVPTANPGGPGGLIGDPFLRASLYLGFGNFEGNLCGAAGASGGIGSNGTSGHVGGGGGGGGWWPGGTGGDGGGVGGIGGSAGAGGGGGGYVILCAPSIVFGAAGLVSANGVAGLPPGAGNSGGGGGGAGGTIIIITNQSMGTTGTSPPPNFSVGGGAGGNSTTATGATGGTAIQMTPSPPAPATAGGGAGGGGAYGQLIFRTPGGI